MKELLDQKVIDVEVGNNEQAIRFTVENKEPFTYLAEGDCCSETWFSEILNLDFLINNVITEVEELEMPNPFKEDKDDGNSRQEYDQFYGYRLATKAGHCTIAFRNSSNGYYGGSIYLESEIDNVSRGYIGSKGIKDWQSISHLSDWTAYQPKAGCYFQYLKLKAFM